MKKSKQVSTKVILDDNKENETPMGPPSSPIIPSSFHAADTSQSMYLGKKTQKQEYNLNDQVQEEKVFGNDIHIKKLMNEYGTYIDIRKFMYGKPSKKGIRLKMEDAQLLKDILAKLI